MSYTCYLGGALWPTPEKLQVKIKGKNKTLVLLNEGEGNFLRAPGLTELTVPFDLPMLTGSRSDIHNIICCTHRILIMLHNDQRIAKIPEILQRCEQLVVVPLM